MNKNKSEIPSVSPEVTFIDDMVTTIENGKFVLPEFQRPYVWKKEDIIFLFDSIYKGYPIGSILLWDGGGNNIAFMKEIGGRSIRDGGEKYYIIDGQQRLTTLFCCLNDDGHLINDKWTVYFDLKNEIFTHSIPSGASPGHFIALRSIRKTTSFIKEARRILEQTDNDLFVERAEILADKIRKYKMAVIKLDGGSLNEIVEVFSRLNSLGKNISQQDLVFALTYTGDGSSRVNSFINEVKKCFIKHELDENNDDIYLQLIKTAIGFEVYDKDWTKLVSRLKLIDETERDKLDKIIVALEKTLEYLVNDLGVKKISLLPYTTLLFMVFHFFHSNGSINDLSNLRRWFFFISIFGLGKNSPSKVEAMIGFFKSGLKKEYLNGVLLEALSSPKGIPVFPNKFSAGSASGKAIYLILSSHFSSLIFSKESSKNVSNLGVYPPKNIFSSNSAYNKRLGQKIFFTRPKNEDDYVYSIIEDYLPTEIFYNTNLSQDEIISLREQVIMRVYNEFSSEIYSGLQESYSD